MAESSTLQSRQTSPGAPVPLAAGTSPRSVIPAQRVIPLQTPVELGREHGPGPRIEVQQAHGRVVAVHVFCRCGEHIALECDLAD